MRIKNETHWRTDHLKAIISRVAKDALEGRNDVKKRLSIVVVYSRGAHSGWAVYSGRQMRLRIPKAAVNKAEFAWLVHHEMGHARGVPHKQMRHIDMHFTADDHRFDWANDLPLEVRDKKPRKIGDVQEARYRRTLTLEKAWETKLKRAQNALKKLRKRKAYYERAIAARK